MKGKIIALAVSFAIGFTGIFFSVRPQAQFNGKGKGKNTAINSTEEFAEILTQIPRGYEYYDMAQQAKDGKTEKSAAVAEASTKNSLRSLTLTDKFSSKEEKSSSTSSSSIGHSTSEYTSTSHKYFQDMTVYFAADGVYYDIEYSCNEYSVSRESVSVSDGSNRNVVNTQTEVITNTYTELDFDFYLGAQGVFLRYNKYNIVKESAMYVNHEKQDGEEDEEKDKEEQKLQMLIDCIRENYGKWINVYYDTDTDFENFDPEKSQNAEELMTEYVCAELSNMLIEHMISVTDINISTLAKLSRFVKLAETKSNDYYDKSGSLYKMTPLGRFELLSAFGYSLPSGVSDYKIVAPIRQSSFAFDLADKTSPAMYLNYDYTNSFNLGGQYSEMEKKELQEEVVFKNIDNTVTPKIGSSKTLYRYMGKAIKKYLEDIAD